MNKRLWLSVCAGFGLGVGTAGAAVWYVATNGSDSAAGTSWETAFATIGNALATNAIVDDEDPEIWVSNGTYNLTAQLVLSKGVRLWGAYGADATILDGGGARRCVFITNGVLDGFTVTNGYADNAAGNQYGGGVYIATGQVLNCTVTGNKAFYSGGGVCGKSGGVGVVSNCVIAGNTATNTTDHGGGGAALYGSGWRLVDCPSIRDNLGLSYGGGVWLSGASVISNCVVSNNCVIRAGGLNYGGGLYLSSGALATHCTIASNNAAVEAGKGRAGGVNLVSDSVLSNCVVIFNKAGEWGAGIAVEKGSVRNCATISGNVVPGTGVKRGGGIYLWSTGGDVSDCTISSNSAPYGGGGLSCVQSSSTVERCVISENSSASNGGGIEALESRMTIRNCLVTRNVCSGSYGGGICLWGGVTESTRSLVENCTIVSNRLPATYGGGIFSRWTNSIVNTILYSNLANNAAYHDWAIRSTAPGGTFTNCCAGSTNGMEGSGFFTDYPDFKDPANGDWRLGAASLCINAGLNAGWMEGTSDLDGNGRVDPFSRRVDIGAYEFVPAGSLFKLR